jgi:F-type H+-transporting ATPase subunit b
MRSEHRQRIAALAVATVMWIAWTAGGPCAVGNSAAAADEAVGAAGQGHAAESEGDSAHPVAASHGPGDAHAAAADAHHPDTSMPPIVPNKAMGELFVFSLLFFWLFLYVAKRLAWRPLISGLDAREARVNRALHDAEAARVEAERLLAAHDARMAEVHEEVRGIVAAARKEAEAEKARIIAKADGDAAALRDRAIAEIEAARARALDDLHAQIDRQAAVATEHVLGQAR